MKINQHILKILIIINTKENIEKVGTTNKTPTHTTVPTLVNWVIKKGNKHIPTSIDRKRLTPQAVLDINTANKMTTKLLQNAISTAIRHGLSLKAGILNAANGNCLFDAVINADIAIIAVAQAIHKDILVFNTNPEQSISPIL